MVLLQYFCMQYTTHTNTHTHIKQFESCTDFTKGQCCLKQKLSNTLLLNFKIICPMVWVMILCHRQTDMTTK